jgi:hypothetical protein
MTDEQRLDAMIDAVAPMLGIAIDPDWRAAIRLHLALSLGHAARVDAFALPDDSEPAAVFSA